MHCHWLRDHLFGRRVLGPDVRRQQVSRRCQRSRVSGVTSRLTLKGLGSGPARVAKTTQSDQCSFGLGVLSPPHLHLLAQHQLIVSTWTFWPLHEMTRPTVRALRAQRPLPQEFEEEGDLNG